MIRNLVNLLLLSSASCQLKAYGPDRLASQWAGGQIPAAYANFGFIPYGHSLYGNVNTNIEITNMCEPLDELELAKIHHGKEITSATFLLVERGGCTFTKKVKNVEDAGAALAIIIDDKDEDTMLINMVDDGAGAGIRIPSIIISKKDGQRLIDFVKEEHKKKVAEIDFDRKQQGLPPIVHEDSLEYPCSSKTGAAKDECETEYELKKTEVKRERQYQEKEEEERLKDTYKEGELKFLATFDMSNPDDTVEYQLWMSSSSDRALDFVEDFERYAIRFDEGMTEFTPHYSFLKCEDCQKAYTDDNCFGGGKYCAHDTHHKTLKGRDIILEDLRQICLYKVFYQEHTTKWKWWRYVAKVHNECYGEVSEECSKLAHDYLDMDYALTKKCVDDSFSMHFNESNEWRDGYVTNNMIEDEMNANKKYQIRHIPTFVMNEQVFRGQLEIEAVMNGICAGFKDIPYLCQRLLMNDDFHDNDLIFLNDEELSFWKILATSLSVILGMAILMCCYRRMVRRQVKQQINEQIETQVNQYMKISAADPEGR